MATTPNNSEDKSYQAVVQKVIRKGRHGPYVVTKCTELGSVTFSLDPQVWQELQEPDGGAFVMLSKIRRKRAGWRAEHARFMKPGDTATR
jgi:hypothetical protein